VKHKILVYKKTFEEELMSRKKILFTLYAVSALCYYRIEAQNIERVLRDAGIPPEYARAVRNAENVFMNDLRVCLNGDLYLRYLVDKQHGLPARYEPDDLVELRGGSYTILDRGMYLRRSAALALEELAAAAKADGVTLMASSAYRPYSHQERTYARNVREMGQREADRASARPGHSQHQLGLVVDFGSITDAFADTRAGRWILVNASRFGWSLSFPNGYENITGYKWESWHYRYVGTNLTHFIDTWFGGIQQYALQFIHEWEQAHF
jgi:D-alanyl-D-alanine carboxypeptidase